MNKLTLILALFIATLSSAYATNYGKFKLTPNRSIIDSDVVVFLLNSSGDLKILENEYYYSVDSGYFFGEQRLEFISGGDEDALHAIFTIKNNKIVSGCAAYIDYKNEYAETMGIKGFKLERWNKYSRKYESMINKQTDADSSECYDDLFRDQDKNMEIF
jgi:hypothetical protein